MKAPREPADEAYRIRALRSLALLDTADDEDFDNVVLLGQKLFDVPICLISLMDSNRQWFKAVAGLNARETPRRVSFCGHAILHRDVMVVLDASQDERFHDNPLVAAGPKIRFYAGAPLWLPNGYPIGTVCLISPQPRACFDADEQRLLAVLATTAMNVIAVRALRRGLDKSNADLGGYWMILETLPVPVALAGEDGRIGECNEAFASLCAVGSPVGLTVNEALPTLGDGWTPESMTGGDRAAFTILPGSGNKELIVQRRIGGFAIVGKG